MHKNKLARRAGLGKDRGRPVARTGTVKPRNPAAVFAHPCKMSVACMQQFYERLGATKGRGGGAHKTEKKMNDLELCGGRRKSSSPGPVRGSKTFAASRAHSRSGNRDSLHRTIFGEASTKKRARDEANVEKPQACEEQQRLHEDNHPLQYRVTVHCTF